MTAVRFAAMGSEAHVVIAGGNSSDHAGLLAWAEERIGQLEALWSRFVETSEISRLNAAADWSGTQPMRVSAETYRLIELAVIGWERTAGRFDPTVHDAVVAAGYDRWSAGKTAVAGSAVAAPGCAQIMLDGRFGTIELPAGVHVDPGGIGKGLAADIVSAELIEAGAQGCLVNVGGDLRVRGSAPDPAGWIVDIDEPALGNTRIDSTRIDDTRIDSTRIDSTVVRAVLVEGAIATSTTERRQWQVGDRLQHHLIDPMTGEPHHRSIRLATVVTRDAWWAEVQTKQLFGHPAIELDNLLVDAAAMVIDANGQVYRSATFSTYEAPTPDTPTPEAPDHESPKREGVPQQCLAN